jgi:O-antigen/teichoic acid export membrane protein
VAIRRAFAFTTLERYSGLTINFLLVAITSRLLSPQDIGIAAIGATLLAIVESIRDVPNSFLIQQRTLTKLDIRTAFTTMLLMTIPIVLALALFASPIANLYGDPRLGPYLQLLAIAFVPGPFERPIMALLRRKMAFGTVAAIGVATVSVNAAVTISMALLDFKFMSFAWGMIAGNWTATIIAIVWRGERFIFIPSLAEWRRALASSGSASAAALLSRSSEVVPLLVLSRFYSVDAVGLFDRARSASDLPNKLLLSGIGPIILPAFSAELREGRSLREPYLMAISHLTAVQWPGFIMLILLADSVVQVLFGSQWSSIVASVQILATAMLLSPTIVLTWPTLMAAGATTGMFTSAILIAPIAALLLGVAALYGVTALALGFILTTLVRASIEQKFVSRHTQCGWMDILSACGPSCRVTLVAVAGPVAVFLYNGGSFQLSPALTVVSVSLAAVGWFLGLYLTKHPLGSEIAIMIGSARSRWVR